jgi:outer membrane lipoprotein LolB
VTATGRWLPTAGVLFFAVLCTLLQTACTTTTLKTSINEPATQSVWQGRIGIKVASNPPQAFSAQFELSGTSEEGNLALSTPLGTSLARMHWDATGASLRTTQESTQFATPDAMLQHSLAGAPPLSALFSWLAGYDAAVPGWDVQLQDFAAGRIHARQTKTAPGVDISIVFEPR